MKELFTALSKFQGECPTIEKSKKVDSVSKNTGKRTKFSYADLSDILEKTRHLLAKNGLCFMQFAESDDKGDYIRTVLGHISGESVESTLRLKYTGDNIQNFGAAITYYKRYALCSVLGIVADEDVDAQTSSIIDENPYKAKPQDDAAITDAQLSAINTLVAKSGGASVRDEIHEMYGIKSVLDLKKVQASVIIKELNSRLAAKEARNVA